MESAFVEAIEAKGRMKRVNLSKNQEHSQALKKIFLAHLLRLSGKAHDEEKDEM